MTAKSKKTKTYPRIRGKFILQKEDAIEYCRYLTFKTRKLMDMDPLTNVDMKEFWKLYDKYAHKQNVFYFVFDVKRDNYCRINCVATSQMSAKEIDGAHWRNESYQSMLKDDKSLRPLSDIEISRLFDNELFWETVLSEYVFTILKL